MNQLRLKKNGAPVRMSPTTVMTKNATKEMPVIMPASSAQPATLA